MYIVFEGRSPRSLPTSARIRFWVIASRPSENLICLHESPQFASRATESSSFLGEPSQASETGLNMDTEPEDLQFLNIFGILRESIKILRSHAKLFVALTVTLIVPLCLVGLGHHLVTEPLAAKIKRDEFFAARQRGTSAEETTEERIHEELTKFYIFFGLYVLFLLAFSLLSTSAIVYSVACIYSETITSYRKVLTVVPRVWKRLLVTFIWAILLVLIFMILLFFAVFVEAFVVTALFGMNAVVFNIIFWPSFIFSIACLIYINCVWHLASVITVLEESYGLGAMKKSLRLIKGKQLVAYCLFLIYSVCTFLIGLGFGLGVVHGHHNKVAIPIRILLGCTLILLLSVVDLMGFLVQTVFYFTCKAHHHESIDRLALSEHLGGYLGEYVPLRGSIQLGDFEP